MNARPREPLPGVDEWATRLDLRNRSGEHVGPCPVCGGTDRFHVGRGRGGARVGCRGCIDGQPADIRRKAFGRVLREAFPERFQSGAGERTARTPNPPRKPPERDSEPIPDPDDADGARSRGVCGRPRSRFPAPSPKPACGHVRGVGHVAVAPALRFSPALSHPYERGRFPCLVAGVQDAHGGFLGVQRIYWTARAPRARPTSSLYAPVSGA